MSGLFFTGLPLASFRPLFGLDEASLAARGARRVIADAKQGFPDRVALRDADLCEGRDVEALAARMLADPAVAYLHVHYARAGCYACRIDRG